MWVVLNPEQVNCTKWTLMSQVDQSGVEDCFSRPNVMSDLLWGTLKPELVSFGLY